jgi:uncharacterized protein YndB with AHSA1/START domain
MTQGEIRKTVVVDAPPEVVFKALTDEKELVQWMRQEARMDPRLGGTYEFKYHWAAKGLRSVATGKILELIPNKRLSYTYILTRSGSGTRVPNSLMDQELTNSVVTWTLDALPDGKTRVTMVHSDITKKAYRAFDGAWGYFADQLARHCSVMAGRSK